MIGFSITLTVGMLVMLIGLIGTTGCCDCFYAEPNVDPNTGQVAVRTDDGLSWQIADDANLPYDREAVLAAIADLIEPDLSGYRFALMFIFQNMFDRDIAFDVYVNGQKIERRKVLARHQEIVAITNDQVLATEAITGLATTPTLGRPMPLIVTFANFVCSDDHIITDQPFILAPLNGFRTDLEPVVNCDRPYRLIEPVYVCPAIIALVIEKTRVRAIELDREFSVPNYTDDPQEPGDPADMPFPCVLSWLPEEVTLLTNLGLDYLMIPVPQL